MNPVRDASGQGPAAGVGWVNDPSAGLLPVRSLRVAESERLLTSALEAYAVAVVQMAPGHWAFGPAGAPELRATASMTDDWLLFDAPLPKPVGGVTAWDVFAANALLPGGLKGCAGASDGTLRLRAELPLVEQLPLVRSVQEVCAGLAAAAAWLRPAGLDAPPAPSAETTSDGVDLQQLCAETAWPFTVRGADTAMVELDVPGAFQQASVALQLDRGLVVSVPVLSEPLRAPVCATAVGAFLLRATGAVRMVRAATGTSRVPVCFEVVRAAMPAPAELAEGFAALSLAWRCAAREAAVLAADQRVAEWYVRRAAVNVGPSTMDFSTVASGPNPQ